MSIVDARLAEIFEWNVETLMYDRHMSIFTVHVDISVIVTHLPKAEATPCIYFLHIHVHRIQLRQYLTSQLIAFLRMEECLSL